MKLLSGCGLLVVLAMLCGCDRSVSDYRAEKFREIRAKLATEPQWVIAMQQVLDALHAPACPGKPRLIHLHTLKGKGVSFMEGQVGWHGKAPNAEQTAQALAELEG